MDTGGAEFQYRPRFVRWEARTAPRHLLRHACDDGGICHPSSTTAYLCATVPLCHLDAVSERPALAAAAVVQWKGWSKATQK